jgi:hypothetical protein
MKKFIFRILSIVLLAGTLSSCEKVTPIVDLAKKGWSAQSVKENNVVVYTKGGTSNKQNYDAFSLNLLGAPNFTLRELDNNSFSGQYEITGQDDKAGTGKLTLKNMSPVATGTTGSIDYSISSISETQLVLVRSSTNAKTGATSTEYTLVSQ